MSGRKPWQPESVAFAKELRKRVMPAKILGHAVLGGPYSLGGISRATGVNVELISLYRSGKRQPTLWAAVRLANYLGINLNGLK